jgi:hypothetical protein
MCILPQEQNRALQEIRARAACAPDMDYNRDLWNSAKHYAVLKSIKYNLGNIVILRYWVLMTVIKKITLYL